MNGRLPVAIDTGWVGHCGLDAPWEPDVAARLAPDDGPAIALPDPRGGRVPYTVAGMHSW